VGWWFGRSGLRLAAAFALPWHVGCTRQLNQPPQHIHPSVHPGIPEASLVTHLDVITPEDAAQLLRDLEASGQLLVKLLPPSRRAEGGSRPPSLLAGRRGGGQAGAAASAASVRHYWPALATAYTAHTIAVPQGCRSSSGG